MKSYLIQRADFRDDPDKKGIDSILSFDYMGASEYEWGALPRSLKEIREKIKKENFLVYELEITPEKVVQIFCSENDKESVFENIRDLSKGKLRLKMGSYFDLWVKDEEFTKIDFWWDIENNFMFWKKDKTFRNKFIDIMKPELSSKFTWKKKKKD